MFLAAHQLTDRCLSADVVVVGAGAAGITVARALHARGVDVLLVEGGGLTVSHQAQALFDVESRGEPMRGNEGRCRVFGGTTVRWTGRCAALDPLDFERRAWVADSGWPFAHAGMARHYAAAAALVGLADDWERPSAQLAPAAATPGRPDGIEPFVWRLFAESRGTFRNFGDLMQAGATSPARPRVLLEADLVGLTDAGNGHAIGTARFRDRNGAEVVIAGRRFLICCGGIENARLLLNFAADAPAPFARVAGSLGRWFMQHPRAVTASIDASPEQARSLQQRFNLFRRRGVHHEVGFALSERAQHDDGLVNASGVLRYSFRGGRISDTLRRPRGVPGALVRRARGWEPAIPNPRIALHVDLEQVPDRNSRILLRDERDALGLRKAAVDWRINPPERRAAAALTRGIARWIEDAGLGRLHPVADLAETGGLTGEAMLESYHHLGATRIADDPAAGVVDANLRVHGIDNLWVCGGSVMPTGGHANPTLTIVALALRLAEHLATVTPARG